MKNKIAKIITILLSVSFLMCTLNTTVLAANEKMTTPGDLDKQVTYGDSSEFLKIAGKVMGFIRNIAVIGGVLLLMILGVKYMMGSVEEKADYKKSLVPLVVGILVVMAATQIMTMVINFFQ